MSQLSASLLSQVLNRGVAYVKSQQQLDGSFLSLSSPKAQDFTKAVQFHSTFSTTLVLQNLASLPTSPSITSLTRSVSAFLLTQRTQYWSWNYWVKDSEEAQKLPYPDDLDDTFCALSGLYLADESIITGEVLAYASQLLTTLEVAEGGPYRTWLTPADSQPVWTDVDLVVNSNIAYFLALQGVKLPKLTRLFHTALTSDQLESPYYPARLPILYFLSRLITTLRYKKILQTAILKELQNATEPLYVSLGILALLNIQYPAKKLINFVEKLISSQTKAGSWPAATFYTGVNPVGKNKFYAGSAVLTTTYCLVAISRYQLMANKAASKSPALPPAAAAIQATVVNQVQARFSLLGSTLQPLAQAALAKIVDRDRDKQIILLPYFFWAALGKNGTAISDSVVTQLAAASVYGWIGYTLYDDILDDEAETVALPLANICLRELTQIFTIVLPQRTGFTSVFQQVMDKLDEANAWEVTNCRFQGDVKIKDLTIPDYGIYSCLADRSLGHALGSVALLISTGCSATSAAVKNLLTFYHHFLIARQLNDDAHDWEKDLAVGQINSVGTLVLNRAKLVVSDTPLSQLTTQLQKIFWYEVIDGVCDEIEKHVQLAKKTLQKIPLITDTSLLTKLVDKQLKSVLIVRKEKTQAIQFMKTYDGKFTKK